MRENITDYTVEELVKAVELYEDLMNGRLQELLLQELKNNKKNKTFIY